MVRPWAWLCGARLDGGGSGLWPCDYPKLGKERKVGGLTVLPQESLDILIHLFVYYMLGTTLGITDEGEEWYKGKRNTLRA